MADLGRCDRGRGSEWRYELRLDRCPDQAVRVCCRSLDARVKERLIRMSCSPRESYVQLLNVIRDELEARGYSQKPQLSSSHEMDMSLLYIM